MRSIELKHGSGELFVIKATAGHPFYVKEHGWAVLDPKQASFVNAEFVEKLKIGDRLVLRSGQSASVVNISEPSSGATFNLVIDGPGTFFVNDLLSHSGLAPASNK